MTMNRRGLLGLFGAGAAAGCATLPSSEGVAVAFAHGVASGDPATDRVILWTRVTPADGHVGPVSGAWRVLDG
ncbi:PhoD-like phosphatase N-terminal domain-containing protein, partial [Brevundimonas sp.]